MDDADATHNESAEQPQRRKKQTSNPFDAVPSGSYERVRGSSTRFRVRSSRRHKASSDNEPFDEDKTAEVSLLPDSEAHRQRGSEYHTNPFKAPDEIPKGEMVGGYQIQGTLGRGGMAIVYKAEQLASGEKVALKVVTMSDESPPGLQEQIFREASALAMILHPNVIRCFGFGEDRGRMYMALEILSGGDAVELLERQPGGYFAERTIIDIGKYCALGLQAIAQAGFAHRDIKPQNIFLDGMGGVKIADLGLAWQGNVFDQDSGMQTMGTPSYMSPEQIAGEGDIDFRTDIYSLGATLYCFAAGRPPFEGDNIMQVLDAVINDMPTPVHELNDEISAGMSKIIHKMMVKDRQQRYQSYDDLMRDFDAVERGELPEVAMADNSAHTRQIVASDMREKHNSVQESNIPWRWYAGLVVMSVILGVGAWYDAPSMVQDYLKERSQAADEQMSDEETAAQDVEPQRIALIAERGKDFQYDGMASYRARGQQLVLGGGIITVDQMEDFVKSIQATDSFRMTFRLKPAHLEQLGPARIFGFSQNANYRNLTISQQGSALEVRVRTTGTSLNGLRPHIISKKGVLHGGAQVVRFERVDGRHRLYVDGNLVAEKEIPGSLANWDPRYKAIIGNEADGGFPWRGELSEFHIDNGIDEIIE